MLTTLSRISVFRTLCYSFISYFLSLSPKHPLDYQLIQEKKKKEELITSIVVVNFNHRHTEIISFSFNVVKDVQSTSF